MRIVIDMQGAQTESRYRGIGRYAMSLANALVRNRGEHEVMLALSGLFPETIQEIRDAFAGMLSPENIRVWYAPGPVRECDPCNGHRREVAELVREAFIASLRADVVLITSLFEGMGDDAVTSIGKFDSETPTAVILYDLIPLISPDVQFRTNPIYISYYRNKLDSLKKSATLLAISESSRQEALTALRLNHDEVVTISSGCDSRFRAIPLAEVERNGFLQRFGVEKSFVMYTGGADERKNLPKLIEAFAALPVSLRSTHQLVFVGRMPEGCVSNLRAVAERCHLSSSDIVFTGFVSDTDLMRLYGICRLFVYPSLHEGFGLPPLEAMACGAPVIASKATSLPEVVGREDALFDPESVTAISEKIAQLLSNEALRQDFIQYGNERVGQFSWDDCAKKAISALARVARPAAPARRDARVEERDTALFSRKRDTERILVSKLDHMGDLVLAIPAIMKLRARYPYARIDALVGSWNREAARMLDVFDSIHVLDFFSKKSADAADAAQDARFSVFEGMDEYDVAIDLRRQSDTRFILLRVPARTYAGYLTGQPEIDWRLTISLPAMPDAPFITTELNRTPIAIQMMRLVDALPGTLSDYIKIPSLTGLGQDRHGRIAIFPKAGNDVKEWGDENFENLVRLLIADPGVSLISVYTASEADGRRYQALHSDRVKVLSGLSYPALIESLGSNAVCVANNSFGAHLASILDVHVVGVYAGHETVAEWAPVFGESTVIYSPVNCSPCHIAHRQDCKRGFECLQHITPAYVYDSVRHALSGVRGPTARSVDDLIEDLLREVAAKINQFSDVERAVLSSCIARSIELPRKKQIFVDVSELVLHDSKTGIQRVVRSILKCLGEQSPSDYQIVPVYAGTDRPGYCVARDFWTSFCSSNDDGFENGDFIDFQAGDIFLGLDLQPLVVSFQKDYLQEMRRHGVKVLFVVYDILFKTFPKYFDAGLLAALERWLDVVTACDGAICISRAVSEELRAWLEREAKSRNASFDVSWFHLGADIENSRPSSGLPAEAPALLTKLATKAAFLMVGTLEPRKGHTQVIDAFEHLWRQGRDVCLLIVGKRGWNVDALCQRIQHHEQIGRRLFWLEAISDEYLERIYGASTCLIAASEGEGFGLPLIEAAQHKLPIVARDLPVFREVAGSHASYFSANSGLELASELDSWLADRGSAAHLTSDGMPFLTWRESTEQLMRTVSEMCGPVSGHRSHIFGT